MNYFFFARASDLGRMLVFLTFGTKLFIVNKNKFVLIVEFWAPSPTHGTQPYQ